MGTPSRLTPLDPSTYEWAQSAGSPGQWRRAALAGETLWIPRAKDYHEMFIGGSLTLNALSSYATIVAAAKAAWRCLRFEVPALVMRAGYEKDGKAYMQYQEPRSDGEVSQWVERTISFKYGKQSLDFQDLLKCIRQKKAGHDADQVFLLLHMEGNGDFAKRIDFMLNADHQIVDGISVRILLGRFLALLAVSLNSPLDENFDWEESTKNLTPPWIGLMNESQLMSGPEYERVAEANKDFMFQKMPQNPGLPLLSAPKTPIQRTHFITLTEKQSTALIHATKHIISPESNVTHLGHAAMVLALLRAYPPGPHSQTLYSPCWLNGRRYLNPFPGQPTPTNSYLPICQSFAPVVFPDLKELVLPHSASKNKVREKLVKVCKMATKEYGKIRERKSMLPECVVLFETLGKNMCLKQQQETSSGNSLPPSPDQNAYSDHEACLPKDRHLNKTDSRPTRTADPFFLSDGIIEQYISHSYFDNTSATVEKKKVFEVDEITFAANAEKNLIVRMSSWRGRIAVSGEWKECDYDGDMIIKFLEDLVGIMLSLIDQD